MNLRHETRIFIQKIANLRIIDKRDFFSKVVIGWWLQQ